MRGLGLPVALDKRQHRKLDRRNARVETQHPLALPRGRATHRVAEERQHEPIDAQRRLNDPGVELIPLAMCAQVEIAAARNAPQLAPAERELVLDVDARVRVVRKRALGVRVEPNGGLVMEQPLQPLHALRRQTLERRRNILSCAEPLELGLLESPRPKQEIARRDLVSERPPHRRHAVRQRVQPRRPGHRVCVREHALRGLGAQIRVGATAALGRRG
eukprot:Amastigsp_a514509_9.p2 type:complete len:218 gc:universal Amastigsp_a514509_9:515-1168(+)